MRYTYQELCELLRKNGTKSNTARYLGMPRMSFNDMFERAKRKGYADYKSKEYDDDIIGENVKLKRQSQKYQDINRVERKSFREYSRQYNTIEDLNKSVVEKLSYLSKGRNNRVIIHTKSNGRFGVLHLTDLHFGEGIDLKHNKYDWDIAGKRLEKLRNEACRFFDSYGIKNIIIAMTGDLMNSSRRLDEVLTNKDNIASSVVGAFDLLRQLINDLSDCYNVKIACCYGNESRLDKDFSAVEPIVSNNLDGTIYKMLQVHYMGDERVQFIGEDLELIIQCGDKNILLVHGNSFGKNIEDSINKMKAKYNSQGVNIDYVLTGHIHSPHLNPLWSRGGSLSGDNAYSYNSLNMTNRASQSAIVFEDNGDRHGVVIDLNNTDKYNGYKIDDRLKMYSRKSNYNNVVVIKTLI